MRLYNPSNEEALRARNLLKEWAGEGLLDQAQHQRMEQDCVCDLRRTNIFLRIVLALFTLLIVSAAWGLFYESFLSGPSEQTAGVFFLASAAIAYGAAEYAVTRARLYRYGIEEALAACSVGFLCAGLLALLSGHLYGSAQHRIEFLIPAAGAVLSLWIWWRFGLSYFFLAAMIFVVFLPDDWTSSSSAHDGIVVALYATGIVGVAAVRTRHRLDYLNSGYSLVEAFLWLGIYLVINLQLSSLDLGGWLGGGGGAGGEFPKPFYWTTWVLIWCLPPVVLARGVRLKDRFVLAAGGIAATLTLVTNKPYLGWPRHTWDPMLLGVVLIGIALFLRRWLASGPGGIRHGFTGERLSGKDQARINSASAALGLLSPHAITPGPQARAPDVRFGGGDSGGGGATSDF